jgi:hypothetical protein
MMDIILCESDVKTNVLHLRLWGLDDVVLVHTSGSGSGSILIRLYILVLVDNTRNSLGSTLFIIL